MDNTGVLQVPSSIANAIVAEFLAKSGRIFNLPQNIGGQQAFFQGVRQTLPLDPIVIGDGNWDALADSLWYGLHALSESSIVIVWPNFGRMREVEAANFEIATELLSDICVSLADENMVVGRPKHLMVLQVIDEISEGSETSKNHP
jgi:hypothetical protein